MSFNNFKTNLNGRFAELVTHLNYINSLEPREPHTESSLEVKILRGFYYVHLYAVLEKTINDLVSVLINEIKKHRPMNCHLIHSLNVITQANNWQSLRDSKHSELHLKAVRILSRIESSDFLDLEPTHIQKNLQNIWTNTILEILELFSINDFIISSFDNTLINEITEKRNAVAHGRESPVIVGERFRSDALRRKLTALQLFCNNLVNHIEMYCDGFKFIRDHQRNLYCN